MESLRPQLIAAGLWLENDSRDPTHDIAQAWQICERIAMHKPELYGYFSRELADARLIFAMHASYAALNICLAALTAQKQWEEACSRQLARSSGLPE